MGTEVWGTGGDIGFTRNEAHAEFIVVRVEVIVPKLHCLSFEQATCVGVNFATAYLGLVTRANLPPGETLLVTGARGGVGSAVLDLGQSLKARLIAVDHKPLEPGPYEGLDFWDSVKPVIAAIALSERDKPADMGLVSSP